MLHYDIHDGTSWGCYLLLRTYDINQHHMYDIIGSNLSKLVTVFRGLTAVAALLTNTVSLLLDGIPSTLVVFSLLPVTSIIIRELSISQLFTSCESVDLMDRNANVILVPVSYGILIDIQSDRNKLKGMCVPLLQLLGWGYNQHI